MPDGTPRPSSDDSSPTESSSGPQTGRNPGAGCLIILIALLSLSFLVGFGIWAFLKQDSEIAKFTEQDPRPTPLPDLVENAAAINVLNSKIETFTTDAGNKREATLTLTPDEINLAIAAFDQFEDLREAFSVTEIRDGQVHAEIAFRMSDVNLNLPWNGPVIETGFRYLNATMIATPDLASSEIFLVIDDIQVPGKTVPEGFINGLISPYRISGPYLEDETLGPWMQRLTSIALVDGALTLAIRPDQAPPASGPPAMKREHLIRSMTLFAIVITAFVGFMLYAAKRNRELPRDE